MSSTETSSPIFGPLVVPTEPVKRWTVAEYHQLLRIGLLTEGDPYELIEGLMVTKMTKNPPHDSAVRRLNHILQLGLSEAWIIGCQTAITLGDGEPEPDIAVLIGPDALRPASPDAGGCCTSGGGF